MRNPGGYGLIVEPGAPTKELDSFTCCHCNRVVWVKPFAPPADAGGFCRLCMKPTCGPCADLGTCNPFEKQLEEEEARNRFRRSIGVMEQGRP
jgi:hypothetical protein